MDRASASPGRALLARMQVPLAVLAILTPVAAACSVAEADAVRAGGQAGYWVIWGAFLAEALLAMAVVPSRAAWLRDHAFSVSLLVAGGPWAPPVIQILRTFSAARGMRSRHVPALDAERVRRDLFSGAGLRVAAAAGVTLVFAGGWAFSALEDRPLGDGVWWALSTVSTVGYGDITPTGPGGRLIGVGLMVVGISLFGLLVGGATERLIPRSRGAAEADAALTARLDEILRRLDRLEDIERRITRLEDRDPTAGT